MEDNVIDADELSEDLVRAFGGMTVLAAKAGLTTKFIEDDEFTFTDLRQSFEILNEFDDMAVLPKENVPAPPEQEKLSVGHFLRSSGSRDYEHVEIGQLQARCRTEVWLDADGNIVFNDTGNDSYAVLDINRLLSAIKTRRIRYEEEVQEYRNRHQLDVPERVPVDSDGDPLNTND